MKMWNPFRRKKREGGVEESVENGEIPKKKATSRSARVLRATKGFLKDLFRIPKLPPGWDALSTGALVAISGTIYVLSEGDSETIDDETDSNAEKISALSEGGVRNEAEIVEEEMFSPLPEISIDAVPGDGAITMISKWAEAAAANPDVSSEALGEKLGALVDAARSGGDVYALAEALAKESGLYQPNEALESFNVFKEGALRLGSDGAGGYTLTFTNPGGDSHTLFSLSQNGVATSHPPYGGEQMIDTKS